jgi:hypothetical protein
MADAIEELKEENEKLKKQLAESESKRKVYENGGAKLYYAQQRKMSEMANVMNKYSLENLDMASKSDATFERVFKLIEKSESISTAAAGLGTAAGVTGDEKKDTEKIPFIESVATKRE